ncbi:MAG: acyltransferase [Lachnospiraceae bacterium]
MNINTNICKWNIVSKARSDLFGLSIISIIIFHFFEDVVSSGKGTAFYRTAENYNHLLGSMGVDVFLFLSGVGLWFSLTEHYDLKRFYLKRMKRVLIPYIIWGGLFWYIRDVMIQEKSFYDFFKDYSLLSFWTEGNRSLWFIGLIILAYAVFPILYHLFKGEAVKRFSSLAVLSAASITCILLLENHASSFYGHVEIALLRIPVFLLGIYCGDKIYRNLPFNLIDLSIVCLGLISKILVFVAWKNKLPFYKILGTNSRRLLVSLFAFSLILLLSYLLVRMHSIRLHVFLCWFGGISLELYLTHVTIRHLMKLLGMETCRLDQYMVCIAVSLICALGLKAAADAVDKKLFHFI